jgi:hypothetical protein
VADYNQFGSAKPVRPGDPQHCAQCEAMLTDFLDGTLSATDQATFDLHMIGCSSCAEMLADAQRGSAWLEMLKSPRPEPSANLLERILAQTSGQADPAPNKAPAPIRINSQPNTLLGRPSSISIPAQVGGVALPSTPTNVIPFRNRVAATFSLRSIGHTLLQPRLAMTAAMAFFSIALTLNLTGVRLSDLRASDLKPSNLKHSFYEANAHVVRYYDNLRVVYELESRVHDLQRASDDDTPIGTSTTPRSDPDGTSAKPAPKPATDAPAQQPDAKPDDKKQDRPKPSPGTSRRENLGFGNMLYVVADRRNSALPTLTHPFEALLPSVKQHSITRHIQEGRLV